MIEVMDQILPGTDAEIVKTLSRVLKKRKIKVHTETRAAGWTKKGKRLVVSMTDKKGKELTVEADKILLSVGEPLVGRLLIYEALGATFREFELSRRKDCAYCGDGREFPGYVDYEEFCSSH